MGETLDLGRRVELVPMDAHFHDISIGLYQQDDDGRPAYLIHTYSHKPGSPGRIRMVRQSMSVLGGMNLADDGRLRFPCGHGHLRACRRVFLEGVKLDPASAPAPRPLEIQDKKSGLAMRVEALGGGRYRVTTEGQATDRDRRIATIAGGIARLGDLDWSEDATPEHVTFPCGRAHDELVGVLLVRAPNVRAVLREEESVASRGVLAAPSQQKN